MNPGLSTTNRAIEKAANILDGLESNKGENINSILEVSESESQGSAQDALFRNSTVMKRDPLLAKIMLEKEQRIKNLQETANASQQMMFMDWLAEASEDDVEEILANRKEGELSFYDEVFEMKKIWIDKYWLESSQAKNIIRQAFVMNTDLPGFSIEDLKVL